MRFIILLLLFVVIGVFVFSNLQPVTLVFFGGSMIARLPLSIWIAIFTGAGLVGSLVIQLLSNLFRPARAKVEPFKPSPSPRPKKPLEPKRQETPYRSSSSFFSTQPNLNSPSYQSIPTDELDDWDIESPPAQTTPIRDYERERIREREPIQETKPPSVWEYPYETIKPEKPSQEVEKEPTKDIKPPSLWEYPYDTIKPKDLPETTEPSSSQPIQEPPPEPKIEEEPINYEVPQSPQNVSRSGSIYSYTYRESTKSQQKPTERVYDADFRVINPPIKENTENIERDSKIDPDEEDWI
jgi:uncharacterized integral membrane protein